MPEQPDELPELERRRAELYQQLARVGDFRPGSLNEVRRKCGKPNCACAAPGHPGHGPQYNLTRRVEGRTQIRHLRPGRELDKARREAAAYQRFRDLVGQVTEVNEGCSRSGPACSGSCCLPTGVTAAPRVPCGNGHRAEFISYREKVIDTVLGPVTLNRGWYHCAECRHGLAPRDAELGVAGASLSPGLTAMNDKAAAAGPFAGAAAMLEDLAGIRRARRLAGGEGGRGKAARAAGKA